MRRVSTDLRVFDNSAHSKYELYHGGFVVGTVKYQVKGFGIRIMISETSRDCTPQERHDFYLSVARDIRRRRLPVHVSSSAMMRELRTKGG